MQRPWSRFRQQDSSCAPGLYVPCGAMPGTRGAMLGTRGAMLGTRDAPVPVSDARNCEFGTWRTVVERLRGAVLRNHADAIAVLIRNGDYASQELRDLERQALRLVPFSRDLFFVCSLGTLSQFVESELVGSCLDPAGGAGVGGWNSLMRLVYYEVRSRAPAARTRTPSSRLVPPCRARRDHPQVQPGRRDGTRALRAGLCGATA